MKIRLLTFYMQNTPRKFGDVFVKKQAFLDNRNMDLRKPQNCLFAKGLVHDFGQKVEVFSSSVFIKNKSRKSVC